MKFFDLHDEEFSLPPSQKWRAISDASSSETFEFIGFEPRSRVRDWIGKKGKVLLRTTDPNAHLRASLIAVKDGYEVVMNLSGDFWEVAARGSAKEVHVAFKNAQQSLMNQFLSLRTKYLAESEPRPFTIY